MNLTAQQFINGFVQRFADDVPARHLDGAEHAHDGEIRTLGVTAGVYDSPESLYFKRVRPHDISFKYIHHHLLHNMWMKRHGIHLPDPFHTSVGYQFDEHPVTTAKMGGWIRYGVNFDVRNFHIDIFSL